MPTLPYVDLETADDELRRIVAALPRPSSIVRMTANAPGLIEPVMTLIMSIIKHTELSPFDRELIILNVAALENGRYEWEQHSKAGGKAAGISDAQIAAIRDRRIDEALFDPGQLCLLHFSEELLEKAVAGPAALDAMKRHFSNREIVEAILIVGTYMMLVRLTETTDVDIEPAMQGAALDKLLSLRPA